MSEQDVINSLLRHVRVLINFYLCFPKILKALIKVKRLDFLDEQLFFQRN